MSLGISTFHFTKWVALHLAEFKSNHRMKTEKKLRPFRYTWKRTVTTSLIQSFWSGHILQRKNKWEVKWSFLHLKNEKSTNSKSYPWQLSSPVISCYFWNLRLWEKKLLMKVLSNEKGIVWGRKRTFTIVHDLEKCYVDSCTEVPFPIRTWSTEFNLVKNF